MPGRPPLRRLGVARVLALALLICFVAVTASALAAPLGSVSGTVVDQTGGSLAGVRVALLAAPNVEVCSTTTDAAGRYRLEHLEPAGYVLVLSKPGFSEYRRSVVTRLLGLPSSVLGDRLHDTAFTQYGVQAKFAVHPTTKDFRTVQYIRGAQLGASRYDQLDGGVGNLLNTFDPQTLDFASVRCDRVGPALFDTGSVSFSYNGQTDDRTYQNINNNRLGLLSPVSEEHNRTSVVGWQAHGTKLLRSHTIGVGGEWYDEFVTSTRRDFAYSQQTEGFTTATEVRGRFPNGARYRTVAVYAQDAFPLFSPRLTATVAVRYSRFRYGQDTSDNASWAATAATLPTYQTSFGDATFNTGVAFALTPQVVLTASVSRGFRAPNVNDFGSVGVSGIGFEVTPDEGMRLGASVAPLLTGTPPASQVWPVHALRPERLMNYEAGAKINWRGLSGAAALFDSEVEGLIERRVVILPAGAVGETITGSWARAWTARDSTWWCGRSSRSDPAAGSAGSSARRRGPRYSDSRCV